MKKLLILFLIAVCTSSSAEVRMLGNLEDGKVLIYAIDPSICKISGEVAYDRTTLSVESIICGDSIFSDGFDI